ncbi:roadblock/LC7 domain-containing protein [candidate division WOR-3 bacterium]|nr:roadblock/LC7 domain-containing protein [candidate division WOR-3 bacterium]
MKKIMEEIASIDGVLSCYLVDREGEIVENAGDDKSDKSLVSALIAAITKELSTQMGINNNFSISVMAKEKNLFLVTQRDFILGIFTVTDIDTGKIRFELRRCVKAISEEL